MREDINDACRQVLVPTRVRMSKDFRFETDIDPNLMKELKY